METSAVFELGLSELQVNTLTTWPPQRPKVIFIYLQHYFIAPPPVSFLISWFPTTDKSEKWFSMSPGFKLRSSELKTCMHPDLWPVPQHNQMSSNPVSTVMSLVSQHKLRAYHMRTSNSLYLGWITLSFESNVRAHVFEVDLKRPHQMLKSSVETTPQLNTTPISLLLSTSFMHQSLTWISARIQILLHL